MSEQEATLDEFVNDSNSLERKSVRWGPKEKTIPSDWRFNPIANHASDIIYPQRDKPTQFDGDIPWVRIEDLDGVYISEPTDGERYVSRELMNDMNLRSFPKGTLMCSCSTTMGVCAITTRELLSNQTFAGIVTRDSINTHYLYYAIADCTEELDQLATGSTISYLSSDKLEGFHLPEPPIAEQRKIATVLYNVDQAIEKTEKIIRQFERIHQGLFQKLIPGGISHDTYEEVRILGRKVNIPTSWEMTTVSQACSEIIDYRGKNPDFSEEGIPHLRNININRGEITLDDLKYVSQDTYDEWMTRGIPQKGDTLLSTEAPMGKTAVLPDLKFSLSQRLIVLSPGKQFDDKFFAHMMGSPFVQKEYEARATGSTVKGISNYNLQEVAIPVPPKKEQKQITQYIDDALESIQKNEQQVNRLKRLKQGLMQDLLSGKVRTTDTNITVPDEVAQHG